MIYAHVPKPTQPTDYYSLDISGDVDGASSTQVGGSHYSTMKIQPIEFIYENKIPYMEANVIKYVCRHASKNGLQDLEKAKHYIDMLIEKEYKTKK